ncbi:MAG: hypothetical protein WA885_01765 [Phormidesmis sp.]
MAIICKEHDLLYLCTAKTGSTSVSSFLIEHFKGEWIPDENRMSRSGSLIDYKHSTLRELVENNLLDIKDIHKLNIFSTTRNPFSWVLSNYLFAVKCYKQYESEGETAPGWILQGLERFKSIASVPFEDYVINSFAGAPFSVHKHYTTGFDTIKQVKVLRLEDLQLDLVSYFSEIGIECEKDIPYLNPTLSKNLSYRNYFTDKSKSVVSTSFSEDIERFGYCF